ncbi:MAG: sulfotransferase [Candidatus Aureabacteria bacterium]|nr:sulfotransferase [Candidatus Auribacterota bacterium]
MNNDKPIFIIANPRSGTTLLRLILSSHSKILIPPESTFIAQYFSRYGHLEKMNKKVIQKFLRELYDDAQLEKRWEISFQNYFDHWAERYVGKSFADVCASLYKYYAEEKKMSKKIWGDKNVAYRNYLDLLFWLYPNARFIHIVRDSRAVFASYKKLLNVRHPNAPCVTKDPVKFSSIWLDSVLRIESFFCTHKACRSITIRYEDIVLQYDKTAEGLCSFLEIDFEKNMKEFYLINEKYNLEPKNFDEWKWRAREPLTDERVSRWRSELSDDEKGIISFLTGQELVKFGYEKRGIISEAQKTLNSKNGRILKRCLIKFRLRGILRNIRFRIVVFRKAIRSLEGFWPFKNSR